MIDHHEYIIRRRTIPEVGMTLHRQCGSLPPCIPSLVLLLCLVLYVFRASVSDYSWWSIIDRLLYT